MAILFLVKKIHSFLQATFNDDVCLMTCKTGSVVGASHNLSFFLSRLTGLLCRIWVFSYPKI